MKHDLAEIIDCIDDEAEIFMKRVGSPEMTEAVQAFMQNGNLISHNSTNSETYLLIEAV